MMDDQLLTLKLRRDKLQEIRASGISEASCYGESTRFRSDGELAAAIADLDRQIAALQFKPVRTIRVHSNKGL